MAKALYALNADLDMVIEDVQNLKRSYNLLDYIAKVVHDVELEQLAQAAQMRRIDAEMVEIRDEMKEMKGMLELIMKHLKIKR